MKMRAKRKRHNAKWFPEPWTYLEHNGMIVGASESFWDALLKAAYRTIAYERAEAYLARTQDDWLSVVNRHRGVIA